MNFVAILLIYFRFYLTFFQNFFPNFENIFINYGFFIIIQMNYKLTFPPQIQSKYRQGRIELHLKNKQSSHAIQPILFQPISGRFHLIFIPSFQLFKNFDNHLKIPSNKRKAICFNLKDCKVHHRMYLGYFIIQSFHSFLHPDFLEGNIIKNVNKGYLIAVQNQLCLSDTATPWNTVFYKFQGSNVHFYIGKINYETNKQVFFRNQNGIIKFHATKTNIELDYELINQDQFYFKDLNTNLFFFWLNNFHLSEQKDTLVVQNYEHIIKKLPFKYFGLDDNSNKIFKLSNNILLYDEGTDIQIDVGQNHEMLFFQGLIKINFKLNDNKLIKDSQNHNMYLKIQQQIYFSLEFLNGKYLKYQSGLFQESIQPFRFRNKPNGYYVFHSSQNYRCLSSFKNNLIENRFIDPEYAFYYSIEDQKMYLNGFQIYIDNMYKLTYQPLNEFKIEYQQESVFIFCLISGNKKYLTYVPDYQSFKFTSSKQSDFYYSNIKDLDLKFDQFYTIAFKQLYLNKNSFLFQSVQIEQRFRDIWQIYGNNFISLQTYVISGNPLFGVKINQDQLNGQPYFHYQSWAFKISNITQKIPNLFECDLNYQTYVYYDQQLNGIIKKNGNYLSVFGESFKVYFHKIPTKLSLPTQFTIKGVGLDLRFILGNYVTSFRQIDKNLYVPTIPNTGQYMVVFWDLLPRGYWRVVKLGNIYQKTLTYSIQQFDGLSIYLKIRTWKSMNGQAFLYNPNIGGSTIVARIPWRFNLLVND